MPKTERIVINTSPLIALVAANGDLNILCFLYKEVLVPFEVCQEILTGGSSNFAIAEFEEANWLQKQQQPINISTLLLNSLDRGEAAVIQLALDKNIQTVCIDEAVGRRVARLSGLSLTGSIGILLRAKQEGYPVTIRQAIERMLNRGIRLSESVINFALNQAGESNTSS
jgi:predicted nucleic acid-binding protein